MTFCSVCGAQNGPNARHCHNCGGPLNTVGGGLLRGSPQGKLIHSPQQHPQPASGANAGIVPSPNQAQLPTSPLPPGILDALMAAGTLELGNGTQHAVFGTMVVGRDASQCQVHIDDQSVSRRHAELRTLQGAVVQLIDLGSSAGTYVNGVLLAPYTPATLRSRDIIHFGACAATYSARAQPASQLPIDRAGATAVGAIVGLSQSQQRMPLGAGRVMCIASVAIWVVTLIPVALILGVAALVLSCTFIPVVVAFGAFLRIWQKAAVTNDLLSQTSFSVQDPANNTSTGVVLFTDRGGTLLLAENDEVRVFGRYQKNGAVLARKVEIHRRNGTPLKPIQVIKGKQPITAVAGLACVILSLIPLAYVLVSMVTGG